MESCRRRRLCRAVAVCCLLLFLLHDDDDIVADAVKIPRWSRSARDDSNNGATQQADQSSNDSNSNNDNNNVGVDSSTTTTSSTTPAGAPESTAPPNDNNGASAGAGAGAYNNGDTAAATPAADTDTTVPFPVGEDNGLPIPPISAILDDMMDDLLQYLRSATASTYGDNYLNTDSSTKPAASAPPAAATSPMSSDGILSTAGSKIDELVKRMTRLCTLVYGTSRQVVLYKPPVGIVSVLAFYQVARRFVGRDAAAAMNEKTTDIAYEQQTEGGRRRNHNDNVAIRGRPNLLDKDDVSYAQYGGIERTRQQLCLAILKSCQKDDGVEGMMMMIMMRDDDSSMIDAATSSSSSTLKKEEGEQMTIQRNAIDAAVRALSCSYVDSHTGFVQDILPEVVQLTRFTTQEDGRSSTANRATTAMPWGAMMTTTTTTNNNKTPSTAAELMRFMGFTARTVEVRTMDALVRMCRDRLLRTTFRLYRTERYWRVRLRLAQRATPRMFQQGRLVRARLEGDRVRLAYAKAAYESELARLGKISTILARRPDELADTYLLDAVQRTTNLAAAHKRQPGSSIRKSARGKISHVLGQIPKLALRFDGKGLISLRSYVGSSALGGQGAYDILSAENATKTNEDWLDATAQWLTEGRTALADVLNETFQKSTQTPHGTKQRIDKLQQNDNGDDDWVTLFTLVRDIHRWRLLGEGTTLRLKDNLLQWLSQWDLFGLPSACVMIWLAMKIHDFMLPKWSKLKQIVIEAATLLFEIVRVRFYIPIRDLFNEIFNHSPSTQLSDFDIDDEERSLDIMLKGLKYGDGTQSTRKEALHLALQQYEEDMMKNLLGSAIGGRLVKLILIQVQQLKVGLLDALESIEVLLNANKLNVQLLAIIPSVVITTVVARLAVQALFNFRTKDIRPLPVVYSEMTEYLNTMEELIMVSSDEEKEASPSPSLSLYKKKGGHPSKKHTTAQVLDHRHLGEFVFFMHHYLVLLDYSSPPFPSAQCDNIHRSLQGILGPRGTLNHVAVSRQLALLSQIKLKHRDLEKYL